MAGSSLVRSALRRALVVRASCLPHFSSSLRRAAAVRASQQCSLLSTLTAPAIASYTHDNALATRPPNLIEGLRRPNQAPTSNQNGPPTKLFSANGYPFHQNGLTSPAVAADVNTYESDLVVVLDMDECLIHSKFFSPEVAMYAFQLPRHQQHQQTTTSGSRHNHTATKQQKDSVVETFQITLPDGEHVRVHKRPFLEEFLQHVTSRYETHIFTAAMEVYASPVLDRLEDRMGISLDNRWYRESCLFQDGSYIKDLSCLNKPPERLVLVDNNPMSFLANPSNGILVTSFYQDPCDTTLPEVADLLYELEEHPDVRPVLQDKFGLEDALRDNGL